MEKITLSFLALLLCQNLHAFCGFYVAKADTSLFNKASKVVLVRDDDKTVLTMSSDFQGNVKNFAMVIPVPEVLKEGQIHVTDNKIVDHLDAYTSPRLVEYFDPDPCAPQYRILESVSSQVMRKGSTGAMKKKKRYSGVTIEAEYTVGEYDIIILSAKESQGLRNWLVDNEYKVPEKAKKVLESYIKQDLKFFVAKVNLEEHSKLGHTYLRPLQVAYESKKFTLPIRLGTANAKEGEDQELFVFALTKTGRVETTNYRTQKIPSNMDLPPYIKEKEVFNKFYKDMFKSAVEKEDKKVVFLEYAWDMGFCDPCAADPLSQKELRELGVFWLNEQAPSTSRRMRPRGQNVYVTRLHVRYNAKTFPDDLRMTATQNRENFQGRYVLRHPFKGEITCDEGKRYKEVLRERVEKENTALAHLTGWSLEDIRKKRSSTERSPQEKKKWWQRIWE
ncbi:MAG: DUF2330 domain-containing protein [Bdellovibrionota bacterium]|nr:DUF2330 domain-containing protein [Bdellovibrionota bacterium]